MVNFNQLPTELLRRIFRIVCLASEDWRAIPSSPHLDLKETPTGPRLHASTLNLALVCSGWKDFVLSDPLLKIVSVHATSFRNAADQLAEYANLENHTLRLIISETGGTPSDGPRVTRPENIMDAHRDQFQGLQTFEVTAYSQTTASEAFHILATHNTRRLSQFKYTYCGTSRTRPVTVHGLRVSAFSLRAPYLTELSLDGVIADPTHMETWHGFCQLCSSAPSLRRLYLSRFNHTDYSSAITEIVRSESEHIPDSAPSTMQRLAFLSLKELYLGGSPSACMQLLCRMEVKGLEILELLPGYSGLIEQGSLHLEAPDWLHHVKRFKVAIYQSDVHSLLHSARLRSITELTMVLTQDISNFSFPKLPELENLRIDAHDNATNAILRSLSASGCHPNKLQSLSLAINNSKTASELFHGVDPAILSNIRCLTLFGRRLDGFGIDDICVEMPNVEVLRIVMPSTNPACIGQRGLEPHLYYDAPKSIRLLPNMTHLGFFLQTYRGGWRKPPPIKSRDVYNLEKFLQDRNKEPSKFRRIERLVFNIPLTKIVHKSLAKHVDTVIDATDGGESEHPWNLEGMFGVRW